jgi:hypothetical protein
MNIAVLIILLYFKGIKQASLYPLYYHQKLRVATSGREGKLSNSRPRAGRAMHGENLRKFTETRSRALRACFTLSFLKPSIQYHSSCPLFLIPTKNK